MKWLFSIYKDTGFTYFVVLGIKFRVLRKRAKRNIEGLFNILGDFAVEDIANIKPLLTLKSHEIEKLYKLAKAYGTNHINRDQVQSLVENMKVRGVCETPHSPRVIVSLTSYPKRMYDIHLCLYSLLTQSFKPDKVVLWLAEEQFPNKENDIPQSVLRLKQFGLDIMWTNDSKSYKKLIPALKEFPDDIIVTSDDDIYYHEDWLELLYEEYSKHPEHVVAHRVQKIKIKNELPQAYHLWPCCVVTNSGSSLLFPTGCGGVLYPPHSLAKEVLNIENANQYAPTGDDIWFWGMRVLAGTKVSIVQNNPYLLMTYINPEREHCINEDGTLFSINEKGENDAQMHRLIKAYPEIWAKVLQDTDSESDVYAQRF